MSLLDKEEVDSDGGFVMVMRLLGCSMSLPSRYSCRQRYTITGCKSIMSAIVAVVTSKDSVSLTTLILNSVEYSTTRSLLSIFAIITYLIVEGGVYFMGGGFVRPALFAGVFN